jgi:hypothetical protein
MSKEQRDAEIERILDIAVADENARLAKGGVGPGDLAEAVIEHDGQKYVNLSPQPIAFVAGKAPYRDEYRELIEAPSPETTAPQVSNRTARGEDVQQRLNDIRSRVMLYPQNVRLDVGLLLEVIDAYESGRL